jgi:hypothetical protein
VEKLVNTKSGRFKSSVVYKEFFVGLLDPKVEDPPVLRNFKRNV